MSYILEITHDSPSYSRIFCTVIFLSCCPFDRHATVQGRAVYSIQCRLVEDLHEVAAIRFLVSATSTAARCDLFDYFIYVNLFNYFIYILFFDYAYYIHYIALTED
jgi:hypothetical protein